MQQEAELQKQILFKSHFPNTVESRLFVFSESKNTIEDNGGKKCIFRKDIEDHQFIVNYKYNDLFEIFIIGY